MLLETHQPIGHIPYCRTMDPERAVGQAVVMSLLTIDPEFDSLLPAPNEQELAVLRASILREGCREPLTVWKTQDDQRIIVDGHNRYRICVELKREPPFQNKKFESREEAKLWMLEHQLGRRNLTDDQRTAIWASVGIQRAKVSRDAQLRHARMAKSSVEDNASPTTDPQPRTMKTLVKDSGLSERALRAAMKLEKTNPEVAARVRRGDLKLREAKRALAANDSTKKYSEKDYFGRIGRALATTLIDPRLTELANIKKEDFTPEAAEGIRRLVLSLNEVGERARRHAAALNKALERCQ